MASFASRALLRKVAQEPAKAFGQRLTNTVTRRNMATEPGAPAKVNFWEAPTNIPAWKEEHIVIAVLTGWAVVIWGASKAFGGGKKEAAPAK